MTDNPDPDSETQMSDSTDSHKTTPDQPDVTLQGGLPSYQELEPGSVFGRYEIIECIDRGGMGIVYRARHTALGKTVALKVVSCAKQSDPRSTTRFLREMQAIGRLDSHPNVLNAYDAGEESGVQYIATELIEGVQLGELIRNAGPLSVSEACKIISQAAMALEHLRLHNLVHRDIKPSNLMLTRDGVVKVVDMGLALLHDEHADQITISGEAMGSIDYMAPEQWSDSHAVDWRSDVYALGCTFYCLLVGETPFSDQRKGSVSRMVCHIKGPFPDIRQRRGDVPRAAVKLLSSMVVKNPKKRLSDLVQLSKQLDVIGAGDLEGLVERSFTGSSNQKPSQRIPIRQGPGSWDQHDVTQSDHHASPNVPDKKSRKGLLVALSLLAISGAAGILGWGYFNRPLPAPSMQLLDTASTDPAISGPGMVDSKLPGSDALAPDSTIASLSKFPEPIACVGHHGKVSGLLFLPPTSQSHSHKIASVADDGILSIFELLSPSKPSVNVTIEDGAAVSIVYDSVSDTLALTTDNGWLQIRSVQDGQLLREERLIHGGFTSLAHGPGTMEFLASDWDGNVWKLDLSSSVFKKKLLAHREEVVYDVDRSPDGNHIAWVGRDPVVTLFDVKEQTTSEWTGHESWVYDVAISPDGSRMATAEDEGTVRVWRFPSGELDQTIECTVPQSLCFFPDNRHLAVGGRGTQVQIWDLESNHMVDELSLGKSIDCIAISSDAKLLAAGGPDGALKVWSISLEH